MREHLTYLFAISFFLVSSDEVFAHICPQFTNINNAEIYDFPVAEGTPSSKWVYQEFHKNGKPDRDSVSGWRIRFSERGVDGSKWTLAIDEAWYTTSEGKEIKVLGGLWPAQIWVPYEQEETVLLDLEYGAKLTPMLPQYLTEECSALGPIFTSEDESNDDFGQSRPIFIKELHDYGVSEMRLFPEAADEIWRRGTELVVWANVDGGNYDNYVKYHFRDDGQILALLGTSGWNTTVLMNENARSGWTPHFHSALWRIHPKIGDWRHNDKAYKVSYNQDLDQNNSQEKLNIDQFETEIAFNDEADEHISVLFQDSETVFGNQMGYAISRLSKGAARHRISNIDGTEPNKISNDYFLLKYHADETDLQLNKFNGKSILTQQKSPENIENGGIVLFATTSTKHIPRNEDFVVRPRKTYPAYDNPNGNGLHNNKMLTDSLHHKYYEANARFRNANKISWHGIELTPRNIHRRSPFSSNSPCQPVPGCLEVENSETKINESGFIWTKWLNRDRASGNGDYELLSDFRKTGLACEKPVDIECQIVSSKTLSVDNSAQYLCEPRVGGVCINKDQDSGKCVDHEVRFLCPQTSQ